MRVVRRVMLSLLAAGGALAAFGLLWASFSPAAQFARAQARWALQAPAAYQAEIEYTYRPSDFLPTTHTCTMVVEVRAAVSPQIVAGACPEPLDIAAIFARFHAYVAAPVASRRCGYGGCVCSLSTFQAAYDPQYGYPTQIKRDWRDATAPAGVWARIVARLPADVRTRFQQAVAARTPCPPGTPNHTPTIAPIYAEAIAIRRLTPLP